MTKVLLKYTLLFFSCNFFLLSCSGENPSETNSQQPQPEQPYSIIKVDSGSAITKLEGQCIWERLFDDSFIILTDQNLPKRQLVIYLPISQLPKQTTTYTVVANVLDGNANHVDIVFSDYKTINNNPCLLQWYSSDSSGTLTLVVDEHKITANLEGIILAPRTGSILYENLNVGEYANLGTLSGSFTLFK